MTVERQRDGDPRYRYRLPSGEEKVYLADEIFHFRGFSRDGMTGIGVVELARIGLGFYQASR